MSSPLVLHQNFNDYVASVKATSENLIKNIFPQKISELNEILDSDAFNFEEQQKLLNHNLDLPVPNVGQGQVLGGVAGNAVLSFGAPLTLGRPTAPVTCNAVLSSQIEIVKPYIRDLAENANLLKMWITFLIPKVEDGNNFGVEIQEGILGEIELVERDANVFNQSIASYHINRGKAISKAIKNPLMNDYKRVVAELDEKEFMVLRMTLLEIRNHYAVIYDLIGKNWEKIIRPRNSNAANLY